MKYEVIKITGVAMGVGFQESLPDGSGLYSERICETLYDTGDDKKDAAGSKKWANKICNALNQAEPPAPTEGVEEAARAWANKHGKICEVSGYPFNELQDAFKAGAAWQQSQQPHRGEQYLEANQKPET